MDSIGFGDYVREARISRQISLRDLARRVGISPTYLSHVELDRVPPPSPPKIRKLAEILGLDDMEALERAGRWSENAAQVLTERPKLRGLFNLVFAMSEGDLDRLTSEAQSWSPPQRVKAQAE